jgi:hypothetical protein
MTGDPKHAAQILQTVMVCAMAGNAGTMLKSITLLTTATTVAGHASYMLEDARCDRDMTVGATIMGVCSLFNFAPATCTLRCHMPTVS